MPKHSSIKKSNRTAHIVEQARNNALQPHEPPKPVGIFSTLLEGLTPVETNPPPEDSPVRCAIGNN